MNQGLITSLITIAITQIVKPPLSKMKTGKWDWGTARDAGGMPSSHSAGVTSLATYLALKKGTNSVEFALCSIFSIIIMYDAMGIRKHTGEIAVEVNIHDKQIQELATESSNLNLQKQSKPLEISLGHQPSEVLGGLILGILAGSISYFITRKQS